MTDIRQGSPEWHALRLGKVTASRVCDVVAKIKTGWGASRANYMAELVAERLTGIPAESYVSAAMQRGSETEAQAKAAYELEIDGDVQAVAFVPHPTIAMSGASPDGLVGADGLVEIKAPNTNTHIETLFGGSVPGKYVTQMQWQMACTGRTWCDFASFDPRMPMSMRLFVKRVERDDAQIKELENAVTVFLTELDEKVRRLNATYGEGLPLLKAG